MRLALMTESLKPFVGQKESIRLIKKMGFDAVDISLTKAWVANELDPEIFDGDYIEHAKEIRKLADELDIPIIQSHAPFPVHRDNDDEYNSNMIVMLKKCIEVCGILGVKNLVIHPWNNWNAAENALFFKKLLPLAKEKNVTICTENMWNWDYENNHVLPAACYSPEDFLEHIKEVNDDNFKACVDVGHANMFSSINKNITPGNMVRTLNKYVGCFHIHDNDGFKDLHATPFTMSLDWLDLAKAIKEINYKGDFVIEIAGMRNGTLEEMIKYDLLQVEAGRKFIKMIEENIN